MEGKQYNWELILAVSAPISIVIGAAFYFFPSKLLKWGILIIGTIAAGYITYTKDKKKANIFTSAAIVVLTAAVVTVIKKFGEI